MTGRSSEPVIVIAGAGIQFGLFLARKFVNDGAKVVLLDRDPARMAAIVDAVSISGNKVRTQQIKNGTQDDVKCAVDAILEREGSIDVLINCAGHLPAQPLESLTEARFGSALSLALQEPFAVLRAVIGPMRQRGYGRIINISRLDYLGLPGKVGAAAANAGIFGMTRAIALEVARDSVTVNNLVLGDIAEDTDVQKDAAATIAGSIPVKRMGELSDVGHAVSFFAAEASKYVTGQTFFVCGGKSVHFSMAI